MKASFKKRLKWYGGIFLLGLLVFGVNMMQYDKVKLSYEWSQLLECREKYFFDKQREANPYLSMTREPKLQPNNPRNGLSKSQIAEAEKAYQACLVRKQKRTQEAKSKKDRTEISLAIGGGLMAFTVFLSIIDFIIFIFRNRRLKISTGEATAMENKKITKIAIIAFIVWGIISFLIAQSGYRHRFKIDTFLILNIPTILFMGYLWIADKFTLK